MLVQARTAARGIVILSAACLVFGCSEIARTEAQSRVIANLQEADRQLNLGHESDARTWLDRSVALDPDSPATYVGQDLDGQGGLVFVLGQHDDWPDMITYLTKAVANPKLNTNSFIWDNLAQAQQRVGQTAASQASYQKELATLSAAGTTTGTFVATDPGQLLLSRANAEWGAGQQTQSRADYEKLIDRYPQNAPIAENALAYSEADANIDLPAANTLAQAAVAWVRNNDPDDETAGEYLDTLAWVQYRMGQFATAARNEDEAVSDIPREPVLHYHLAQIYHALNDAPDAQIEIERAAALCPSDAETQEALRIIEPSGPPAGKA